MVAKAALGRAKRQVMLDSIPRKNLDPATIKVNGQRHRHGAFGELETGALILGYLQKIGHDIKLPASHAKRWVIVNFHGHRLGPFSLLVKQIPASSSLSWWPENWFSVNPLQGQDQRDPTPQIRFSPALRSAGGHMGEYFLRLTKLWI